MRLLIDYTIYCRLLLFMLQVRKVVLVVVVIGTCDAIDTV